MSPEEVISTTRDLKRRFFAMRNGMIGEQMRRAGANYRIIFGLNLPQIVEIAKDFPVDRDFAESLRHNSSTRESLLIAPMLYPREEMDEATAIDWISTAPTVEVIDILCHRLLRHLPFAPALPEKLLAPDCTEPLMRYCGIRLMFNLLTPSTASSFLPLAKGEMTAGYNATATIAAMLVDEIEFLLEDA